MDKQWIAALAAMTVGSSGAAAWAQRYELSTVWATGDAVPGQAGVVFAGFGRPSLGVQETVPPQGGFIATLSGAGVTGQNDTCVFRTRQAAASGILLREGDQVAGQATGVVYDTFERAVFADGSVTVARVRGADVTPENDRVLVRLSASLPTVITRTGTEFSPLPGGVVVSELGAAAAGSARTMYLARLAGSGVNASNDQALLSVTSTGAQSLVARTGEVAPGLVLPPPAVPTFADLWAMPPAVYSRTGNEAWFFARLSAPYAAVVDNRSLWRSASGGAKVVAAYTNPFFVTAVGGQPAGMSFDRDYRFMTALNSAGNGPGAPAATLAQGFNRLLEVGSAVPGLTGVTIGGFDPSPVVNSTPTNTVATVVTLAGAGVTPANARAVYASAALSSPIVARAGDPAPGTGPGVVLADFAPVIPSAEVNGPRLLIRARLAGPGVTADNDEALFAAVYKQRSTTLVMIAREGDAYTVRPGNVRTIAAIWPTLGWNDEPGDVEGQPWNGRGCAINNGGQVLTRLTFTDGTQAIAWSDLNCLTGPVVLSPPQSLSVSERATVTLTADVRRIGGGVISWRKDGVVVTSSARISGLGTTSMTIRDVMESDEGTYTLSFETCAASGPLTQATVATLTVSPCPPDIDSDGARTVGDIFAFLGLWFAGDPRANFDGVGGVGVDDIFVFLSAWFVGCP